MADVVMAAGIDAARDLDLQLADVMGALPVLEAQRDLLGDRDRTGIGQRAVIQPRAGDDVGDQADVRRGEVIGLERLVDRRRSEEHTSELQSLMRISYAVFCLKKKTK